MNLLGRLRSLFRHSHLERDMNDELRFHVEEQTQRNLAAGMAPDEAARAARRQFGWTDRIREEARDARGWTWLEDFVRDVRHALRSLRKSPGFTAVAVLSLALGIGANTTIFSLLNAVVLRSLPVQAPHELRSLRWEGGPPAEGLFGWMTQLPGGLMTSDAFSYETYRAFRDNGTRFDSLAAHARLGELAIVDRGQAFTSAGLIVSGNFFEMLGLQAIAGRTLSTADDQPAVAPAAVISYACWQRQFGSDAEVLGRSVTINRHNFTIVGILPERFHGVEAGDIRDFYVPMSARPQLAADVMGDRWWVRILGRLQRGADTRQAWAELDVLFKQSLGAAQGNDKPPHARLLLEDGSRGPLGGRDSYLWPLHLLLGVVALVLFVACANLAGLLLARSTARRHEMAVRAALGAGRGRLLRQSMTESLLISLGGAALGWLFAVSAKSILPRLLWPATDTRGFDLSGDIRVFAFMVGVTLVAAILVGLAPAGHASRVDPVDGLKTPRCIAAPTLRLGRLLVVAQVGLSLVLVAGAGLFTRTLVNVARVDPGYAADGLLVCSLSPTKAGYRGQRTRDFYRDVGQAIQAIPGVRGVAFSDLLPQGKGMRNGYVTIPGRAENPDDELPVVFLSVSPTYFSTMEIPLLAGRSFADDDDGETRRVGVINEAFADAYFANANPIGRAVRLNGRTDLEIVGVYRNTSTNSLKKPASPTVFLSEQQERSPYDKRFVLVRTALPPLTLVPATRKAVAAIDPTIPVADVTTLKILLEQSIAQERLFATLCIALAGLALLLSCLGLYGLMTYNIARRTSEFGVRMALGAQPGDVARTVLREALLLVAAGAGIGLPAIFALSHLVESRLFGVAPHDPLTIAASIVALVVVAALAAWLPVRRAARVDPMIALRAE